MLYAVRIETCVAPMDDLRELQLDLLVEPWVLLRPVKRQTVAFMEMKDSIERNGFINSISARPSTRKPGKFEVIDGMWRLGCAIEIGLKTIPTIVKQGVTDDDVLALQIQANAIRPETTPCDFARQLKRLQTIHLGISLRGMSVLVAKHPGWISKQLDLLELTDAQQKMVDRGEICLQNAYTLAKIPIRFRKHHVDQAKVMTAKAFSAMAAGLIKQYTEAVRQGKMDAFYTEAFDPVAHLRSIQMIQEEVRKNIEGPLLMAAENCTTPTDGWNQALLWVMHLDRESVTMQERAVRARARKQWKDSQESPEED